MSRWVENRLKKLAHRIDALVSEDDRLVQQTREIEELRRKGAVELHLICHGFVTAVNQLLVNTKLELAPEEYSPASFQDSSVNLLQINARGRLLQVEFESTEKLISSENFRVPHILEGAVRCFNQDFLDDEAIEEQFLFYCLEKRKNVWRFFDARTYRTGLFDRDYLVSLMEKLV